MIIPRTTVRLENDSRSASQEIVGIHGIRMLIILTAGANLRCNHCREAPKQITQTDPAITHVKEVVCLSRRRIGIITFSVLIID
jgi:hypothetical protein